jgi:hypothetical protein
LRNSAELTLPYVPREERRKKEEKKKKKELTDEHIVVAEGSEVFAAGLAMIDEHGEAGGM